VAARVVGIGQKVNASYHRYGLKGKSELESMFFFLTTNCSNYRIL
jgi:hypothetical protein